MTHHPDVQLYLIDYYYSKDCIEGLNLKITLSGRKDAFPETLSNLERKD